MEIERGGFGSGVNPEGKNFPFVAPSADIQLILADFYLAHEVRPVRLPLRLYWIYGLDDALADVSSSAVPPESLSATSSASSIVTPVPRHQVDLLVVDANDEVVFDSTEAENFRSYHFGSRFLIHEWSDPGVCRIVQHRGWDSSITPPSVPHEIYPENGVLDERVSELLPQRVTALKVDSYTFRDNVVFQNGFNTAWLSGFSAGIVGIATAQTLPAPPAAVQLSTKHGGRKSNIVTLLGQPGVGLGRYPGCEEPERLIRRINNVQADAYGNLRLDAAGCYFSRQPASIAGRQATPTEATLRIGNDCGPCCECVDYENTYKGLKNVHARFEAVGVRLQATRTLFKENIARWLEQRDCRLAKPLRLGLAVSGSSLYVGGLFCNFLTDCSAKLQLDFHMTVTPIAAVPDPDCLQGAVDPCGTVIVDITDPQEQEYTLGGEFPDVYAVWDTVAPGRSVRVRFQVDFPCAVPLRVTVQLTGTINGVPVPSASNPQTVIRSAIVPQQGCLSS